jgi:nicotinamidase-related amidase
MLQSSTRLQRCGPTVVLLVHLQYRFFHRLSDAGQERISQPLMRLLQECASHDVPVVALAISGSGDIRYEFLREIKRVPRHCIVRHAGRDGFADTILDRELERLDAGPIVLGGIYASECVFANAKSAHHHGHPLHTSEVFLADRSSDSVDKHFVGWFRQHGTYHMDYVSPLAIRAYPSLHIEK